MTLKSLIYNFITSKLKVSIYNDEIIFSLLDLMFYIFIIDRLAY